MTEFTLTPKGLFPIEGNFYFFDRISIPKKMRVLCLYAPTV